MARKKEYIEEEVLGKAMELFWHNGYHNTSMQMLEEAMGINKFSIYSSFGSKHKLFLKCLKIYQENTKKVFEDFANATNGVEDIKNLFYEFARVCNGNGSHNGCLIINTYNEFAMKKDELVDKQIQHQLKIERKLFIEKLKMDTTKSKETILQQANFLMVAKHGLATASRVSSKKEIKDYIEMVFKNI